MQRFYLKISLGSWQRNNPIPSQLQNTQAESTQVLNPSRVGLTRGNHRCHHGRTKALLLQRCFFPRESAPRQRLKQKMWKCDLHRGESLGAAAAGRDPAQRFHTTRFNRLKTPHMEGLGTFSSTFPCYQCSLTFQGIGEELPLEALQGIYLH